MYAVNFDKFEKVKYMIYNCKYMPTVTVCSVEQL